MFPIKILSQILILHSVSLLSGAKVTEEEYSLMPTLFHLDDYDTCMNLGAESLYCSVSVKLSPQDAKNLSRIWNIIQDVIEDDRNYRHDLLRHGICIKKSCPDIDAVHDRNKESLKAQISECYTSKYASLGLQGEVTEIHCETDQRYYPVDQYDIAVAIGLGMLIWIVMFSSFYEGMARYKSKEEYNAIVGTSMGRLISCFSIPKNWARLRSDNSNSETDPLKGIQGVRFFNTQLVIMAHVSMVAMAGPVANPTFLENFTRQPQNVIFVNGYCIVQTFMLVTGFLISYNLLLVIEKRKKFQLSYVIMALVNRYIRLTPCLIVMMALNATWLYRIGNGPMWDKFMGSEYRNCRQNWWTNLLYINNYCDAKNMCMQQTWYLATDTQLFLAALVVVAFMWKYQNRMKLILTVSVAFGFILPFFINYYNNYDIVIRAYPEAFYSLFLDVTQWHVMYSWAPTNFGAYALGLTFGYLHYTTKDCKIFTKKIYVGLWWLLIWGMPLGVIFYGAVIYSDDYQYDRLNAAIYATLQRNLFSLGLCLFIYGLAKGAGWFLRDCVTWSPLQVLGRLTYCTYLVHVVVIRIRGGQARLAGHLSYYYLLNWTIGDAVFSYMLAAMLALFVELPASALQKLIVPQLTDEKSVVTPKSEPSAVIKPTPKTVK